MATHELRSGSPWNLLLLCCQKLGWPATQSPTGDDVQAYIDIPAEDEAIPPTKGAADRAVLDRLSISVNPKIFANRIQFIKDKKQLADVRTSTPLSGLVFSGCGGGGEGRVTGASPGVVFGLQVVSEAIESAQKTSRITLSKRPSSG